MVKVVHSWSVCPHMCGWMIVHKCVCVCVCTPEHHVCVRDCVGGCQLNLQGQTHEICSRAGDAGGPRGFSAAIGGYWGFGLKFTFLNWPLKTCVIRKYRCPWKTHFLAYITVKPFLIHICADLYLEKCIKHPYRLRNCFALFSNVLWLLCTWVVICATVCHFEGWLNVWFFPTNAYHRICLMSSLNVTDAIYTPLTD